MRKTLARIGAVVALLALLIPGAIPETAQAETISITPPKFELFGNPGDVITEKIKVNNDSTEEIVYQVDIEDFKASGEDGSIDLVDPEVSQDNFSLASWITVEPSKFSIPASQERVITFNIRIPRTGEPGGHYASVLIRRAGTQTAGGASVDTRLGSLVLLRVSGAIDEKANIESFTTEPFSQYGPISFNTRFKNDGNVHVAPTGTIVITNIFGKKVKEIAVNPATVLPDSTRVIQANWDDKNLVGRYTASLVLKYGQEEQTLSASTSFVVFPIYLLVIILVVVVLLYLMIAKRKSFKRFINRLTRD